MKYASDFRTIARDSLKGKWGIAVIAGLLASLLGAISSSGPEVKFNYSDNGANVNLMFANQEIYSSSGGWLPELNAFIVGGAIYIMIAALDDKEQRPQEHINSFKQLSNSCVLPMREEAKQSADIRFLPAVNQIQIESGVTQRNDTSQDKEYCRHKQGIIASYSYAMIPYIQAEHPELAPSDVLARSKEMMEGNRWRLFCLQFSFIGWGILSALTLGIGNLWLTPYKQAATAAFYRDVSGTEYTVPPENNEPVFYIAEE